MKCSACRKQLGAYQDGIQPAAMTAQMQAHLDSCVGCRVFAEEMMVVEHRLAQLTEIEPRVDFTQLVMAKVATTPAVAPRPSRIVWLGVYDLLAWALVIFLTATGILRWKSLVAQSGVLLGKLTIAGDALYRVADHFHLTTLALVGGFVEGSVLLILLYAGRRYLAGAQSALFGAQTT